MRFYRILVAAPLFTYTSKIDEIKISVKMINKCICLRRDI